ncbi:caspase-1-like [Nematolebias whitei]|uniref:caspase-1-like n=1 Tax=Nematolebias whitei TaxID=451745 RepID=UPI001898639F|nr:caspase-1-like [Nematolebias whitei]
MYIVKSSGQDKEQGGTFVCIFTIPDKELSEVRHLFVDKVSKEIINQLLDCLLEDGVLNHGEKDSILQENVNRADKARNLFDTVLRKGKEASRKMVGRLEQKDSTLHKELGLSSAQSAQPAASPQMAQSGSATLECTIEEFWKTKQNDSNVYPVAKVSYKNRVALLITNIKFSHETQRYGAEKDEENMERLFQSLGYEVVKYRNLTGKAIEEALFKFAEHSKLKEADSVFVVIMSHGKLGAVLGVDWKQGDKDPDEFPINNIFTILGPKKCPGLINKPKIIVIQACRGDKTGSVFLSDGPNQVDDAPRPRDEDFEEDNVQWVHKEKDFISLLSCTPDTVSYRQPNHGSLLIQYINEIFKADAHREHIQELFRKVMQRFEGVTFGSRLQMPTIDRSTLTKHFYLFPGLVDPNL